MILKRNFTYDKITWLIAGAMQRRDKQCSVIKQFRVAWNLLIGTASKKSYTSDAAT